MRSRIVIGLIVASAAIAGGCSDGKARHPVTAAPAPYSVTHVRQVFAAHDLSSTVPGTFAVGWSCGRMRGLAGFVEGSAPWHGMLFKDERSAARQNRCMGPHDFGSPYVHLHRGNLVIVAKSNLALRIRAALAAL